MTMATVPLMNNCGRSREFLRDYWSTTMIDSTTCKASCVIIDAEPDWFAWGTYVAYGCKHLCCVKNGAFNLQKNPPRLMQSCVTKFVELWPMHIACFVAPSFVYGASAIRPYLVIRTWLVFYYACFSDPVCPVWAWFDTLERIFLCPTSCMCAVPCTLVPNLQHTSLVWSLYLDK